ncbi:hypothetical protein [Caulobacter sp. S45]|uniref:hypothetical protein n=1 Tax=Caulobacter sp. S45 TaxID=1641861 RepID=UPI00131C797D|nr:hypothetical protein [Caulobacter sp. S45]
MNPELQRNLWLDATPRRLTWAGVVVLIAFALVWLVDRGRHAYAAILVGALLFFAAGLMWAPRAARRSVTNEVVARTWDFQRLSALAPWEMTWGKLAGSTLRPWVVAGGGVLIAALQLASTTTVRHAGFWVLVALALGVTVQAAGLATGLLDIRRGRASGRPLSGRAPGLAILALALLTFAALAWARIRIGGGVHTMFGQIAPMGGPVSWFGHDFPPVLFAGCSLVLCAGWALVWAWRLMRLELQLVNTPWAWALFVIGAATYAAGFDPSANLTGSDAFAARLVSAGVVLAALAYVGAFAEPADRVRARQFANAIAKRDIRRTAVRLPLVVLPSKLAVILGLVVALIHVRAGETHEALFMLALLAFFVRDLGVIAWRRFARAGSPGDFGVAATLVALYVIGALVGRLFGGETGQAGFLPSQALPGVSAVMGVIEAAALWALAAYRISRPSRRPWSPKPSPSPHAEKVRP